MHLSPDAKEPQALVLKLSVQLKLLIEKIDTGRVRTIPESYNLMFIFHFYLRKTVCTVFRNYNALCLGFPCCKTGFSTVSDS